MTTEQSGARHTPTAHQTGTPPARGLRRNLSLWQVLGVSIGVMGLTLSANINPQGAEPAAGRAIPLTFAIATVGVLLLSHSFVRLSQHFNTSGSVFGFVGATLGARVGTIAGWCLLGTYLLFGTSSAYSAAIFSSSLLKSLGLATEPPGRLPYLVALIVVVVAAAVAITPAKRGADLLLVFELATVVLIVIVSVVVLFKISSGGGPQGQTFTLSVFQPAKGTGGSSLFLGAVFGFLAFAGFEGAATLGEEAREPRRSIPRAILGTVLIGGVFYVFTSAVEVMGFGTRPADLDRFHASGSLFGDLGGTYLASWVGDLVTVGTMVSAFGGALGCVVGAARLSFSLARSATAKTGFMTRISPRFGTPVGATITVSAVMVASVVVFGWILRQPVQSVWGWIGTVGTFIVLVVYLLATVGAARMLSRTSTVSRWEIVIPIAAIVVLGYTLYRNVVPYPSGAARWLPVASGVWILIALVAVVCFPAVMRRIGERLTADEGLDTRG
ncbi:APC family permease [Actinoallomurus soli]|uniref:APC family permease n=1 Tax=Actinoallomurus soli TaxID=2952535 RepID=UPI00209265EA|nr:APC family permease [Actinoallomurus soli]MCO5970259.1 APC family permease [Actinoallomurus soli]